MPPRLSTGSTAHRCATSARTSSACRNSSREGSWPERQAKLTATPASVDAGQAGELGGDRRGGVRQDALAAVAEVHSEQDLDWGAGGVLSEHAGGARVAEQHAVRDLRHRLELVRLRRRGSV